MKRRLMALFLALTMLVSMAPGVSASDAGFSDVAPDAWYAEAVKWAVDNNITGGIGDGKFGPDNTCTRGQVVTFLWAAAGKPVMENADNPFSDVSASDWYYNAVMWAVENNITGGTSATTFSPEAPCTRAQVVTFLYAAEGKPAVENAKNDFADVAANDWFFAPVMWAVANDITGGIGNGCFGPNNPCTRGQIALFLYKASLIGGNDEPEVTPKPAAAGTGYAICELEFADEERNTLRTKVSAESECVLVMEILSEDGSEQLAYVERAIKAGTVLENVEEELHLTAELPEYVLLQAKLQDADGKELCNPFVSRHYTEAYERFAAQTESDFAPERVIDLLEENDGNFVVTHEDVRRIQQTDAVNVLSSRQDGVCVFEQADDLLKGIQKGDKLMIVDMDGQYVGIIVKSITVGEDGVVEIREKENVSISDFYSLIKIEADLIGQPQEQDMGPLPVAQDMGPLPRKSDREYLYEIKMGPAVSNSVETVVGTLETLLAVGAKLELVYDPVLLGRDYLEYSLLAAVMGGLDLTIGPNTHKEEKIEIASIPLVGLKEIAEIPAELSFVYGIDCAVGGNVTVDVEAVTGFVFQNDTGVQRVEYKEAVQQENSIKTAFGVKMGLLLSIGAEFFDEMLEAYLGAECGIDATGEMVIPTSVAPNTDSYHACIECIDAYAKGYFEIEMVASYEIDEWLEGTVLDFDIIKVEWNIGAFHLSVLSGDDGVFEGMPTFGWGKCPNRKYRVDIELYHNGEEVNGAVKLWKGTGVTGYTGPEICVRETPYAEYLYPGDYWVSAAIGNLYEEKKFSVRGDCKTVKLEVEDPTFYGTVTDAEAPEFIANANIVFERDGAALYSATADAVGMFSVQVEPGTYLVTCSAKDYYSVTEEFEIKENLTHIFELEKKVPGAVVGTVSKRITVDGTESLVPVADAVVTVYAAESGEPFGTISMDSVEGGVFVYDLPMGNYIIKVTADGCDPYEAAFTVTSEDIALDVVMVPEGTNEAAYAAYVPVVEQAIQDANECIGEDVADNYRLTSGELADLDGDGVDEMLLSHLYTNDGYVPGHEYGAILLSVKVYDFEDGELKIVKSVNPFESLKAIVTFDGIPTVLTLYSENHAIGENRRSYHFNYGFCDYPSMDYKLQLGYQFESGRGGVSGEKYYIDNVEVDKSSFLLALSRSPDMRFEPDPIYASEPMALSAPMSLNELLSVIRQDTEREIYTRYLLEEGYASLDPYGDKDYAEVSTVYADIDGNGIKDLLLYYTDTEWGGVRGYETYTVLYTIDAETKNVVEVCRYYNGGGSMGGDTLSLYRKNPQGDPQLVVETTMYDGNRKFSGGQILVNFYGTIAVEGKRMLETGYYLDEYSYYWDEIQQAKQNIHYIDDNGYYLRVYTIDDQVVTQDTYKLSLYRGGGYTPDSDFFAYKGTYEEPIRP